MTRLGFLTQGGAVDVDQDEAHRISRRVCEELRARTQSQNLQTQPQEWTDRATYAAAANATSNTPTDGSDEGVATTEGRVFVEALSVTVSGGSSLDILVIASQNGVRAQVAAPVGQTITGGSFRFWLQDKKTKQWGLGGVDEPLATGVRRVWCTDQFITVGSK